jgi:hypothetical protein
VKGGHQAQPERDFSTKTNILNQLLGGIGTIYTSHTHSTPIFFSEIFFWTLTAGWINLRNDDAKEENHRNIRQKQEKVD